MCSTAACAFGIEVVEHRSTAERQRQDPTGPM
jgi:hypothetical protein